MRQTAWEIVVTFLIALLVSLVVTSIWAATLGGGEPPDIATAVWLAIVLGLAIPITRAIERARKAR